MGNPRVKITEDLSRPAGFAVLTISGIESQVERISYSIVRHGFSSNYLGKTEWQAAFSWLEPEDAWYQGETLKFVIPPEISWQLEPQGYQLKLNLPPNIGEISIDFFWPDLLEIEEGDAPTADQRLLGTGVKPATEQLTKKVSPPEISPVPVVDPPLPAEPEPQLEPESQPQVEQKPEPDPEPEPKQQPEQKPEPIEPPSVEPVRRSELSNPEPSTVLASGAPINPDKSEGGSKTGLIIGIIILLLALLAAGYWFFNSKKAATEQHPTTAETAEATPEQAEKAEEPVSEGSAESAADADAEKAEPSNSSENLSDPLNEESDTPPADSGEAAAPPSAMTESSPLVEPSSPTSLPEGKAVEVMKDQPAEMPEQNPAPASVPQAVSLPESGGDEMNNKPSMNSQQSPATEPTAPVTTQAERQGEGAALKAPTATAVEKVEHGVDTLSKLKETLGSAVESSNPTPATEGALSVEQQIKAMLNPDSTDEEAVEERSSSESIEPVLRSTVGE